MPRSATDDAVLHGVTFQAEPFRLGRVAAPPDDPVEGPAADLAEQARVDMAIEQRRAAEHAREQAYAQGYRAAQDALRERDDESLARAEAAARATGHEHGMDQARADSQAALASALSAQRDEWQRRFDLLDNLLVQGAQQLSASIAAAEDEIVALAFEAVAAVLGETLATSAGLRGTVANLIARHGRSARVKVHVNPLDWAEVTGDPESPSPAATEFEWVADPEVAMGGLVIHHAHGSLNASLGAVLQNLQSTLLLVRAKRRTAALAASDRASASEGTAP